MRRARCADVRVPEVLERTVTRQGEHDSCERRDMEVVAGSQRSQDGERVATECEATWVSCIAANASSGMSWPVRSEAGSGALRCSLRVGRETLRHRSAGACDVSCRACVRH